MRCETNIYQVSLFTVTLRTARALQTGTPWHLFESRRGHLFGGMGCAATQSGAEQVQGKYICTLFDLACVMY